MQEEKKQGTGASGTNAGGSSGNGNAADGGNGGTENGNGTVSGNNGWSIYKIMVENDYEKRIRKSV